MQKERSHKLSAPAALLVTLIVCLIAFGLAWLLESNSSGSSAGKVTQVNVSLVKSVQVLSDGFVYYNGNTVGYVNSSGTVKWTYMAGSDAQFIATDYGVAVIKGKLLTLLKLKDGSSFYSSAQADDILTVNIGSQYSAIITGEDNDCDIRFIDRENTLRAQITDVNALVVKTGFYSNDTLFWELLLETNGTVAGSTIATYKPASNLVSGSISDSSQVVYDALFLDDGIICIGEKYVKRYNYSGKEIEDSSVIVYGWFKKAMDLTDDPLMVFLPDESFSGDQLIKDFMMLKGTDKSYARFPFGCDSVYASQGVVYGFSIKDSCIMTAAPGRDNVTCVSAGLEFDKVYGVMDGAVAVMGQGGQIYLISIR